MMVLQGWGMWDTQLLWRNRNSTTISIFMDLQVLTILTMCKYWQCVPSFLLFSWGFPNSGMSKHFQGLYIDPAWSQLSLPWPKILYIKIAQSLQPATKKRRKKGKKKGEGRLSELAPQPIYLPLTTAGTLYRPLHAVRKHNYAICPSHFFKKLAAKTTITGLGAS